MGSRLLLLIVFIHLTKEYLTPIISDSVENMVYQDSIYNYFLISLKKVF
jgi:hypothetical protein